MCIITSINLPSSTYTNFYRGIVVYGTKRQSSWRLLTIDHTEITRPYKCFHRTNLRPLCGIRKLSGYLQYTTKPSSFW